ncbi:MAG TPA: phosphopantetheine-binding protein [Rhizomicrobium sp.]|nr:phosphopantetheine-binding protein [Rhizomicrobium sp.]
MVNEKDIVEIVSKQAKVEADAVKSETRLADLDLQSIDIVELVFAIEEKFDIEVPYAPSDQNAAGISFKTVGDIINAVNDLVAKQHPEKAG